MVPLEHRQCRTKGRAPLVCRADIELTTDDSIKLLVRRFSPDDREAPRTLLLIHGLGEHGERYCHVVEHFVESDWNVIVPDLRGHGRSGGIDTHVNSFRRYTRDVDLIYEHFGLSAENTAGLAHSMGALVTLRHVQTQPNRLAALALSSPLLGVNVRIPRATLATGRLMSLVAPRTRFRTRIDPKHTTRNPDVLARRQADPLIRRSVTAGWFFAMRTALHHTWDQAHSVDLPLLIVQAGEDRIVDPVAPVEWMEMVPSRDKSIQVLPEHYHEVLNEPDWFDTLVLILDWLERRLPAKGIRQRQQIA